MKVEFANSFLRDVRKIIIQDTKTRMQAAIIEVEEAISIQEISSGQATTNYRYDAIGNLIEDVQEGITTTWNVYGKVATVLNVNSTATYTDVITFTYDAMGNRVKKSVQTESGTTTTWYVRDASGNILANYELVNDNQQQLTEIPLYGSDRLGIYRANITRDLSAVTGNTYTRELNKREYELKDHLGNVRAVVADRKLPASTASPSDFTAVLEMYANYYPFGMVMEDRQYTSGSYRYGYNTQEKVDEIAGAGNHYTALFWEYNPRVDHRWNLDPKPNPSISPYAIMQGNQSDLV
ncbi:MAG: hypothetical protein WD077_06455 [Bacteroidia bacterium]